MYFGVFLALGFGGVAERPKTLIINFITKHPPQRRRAASTAHPEQVSRTVESDQSSTLLPLSDLKTFGSDCTQIREFSWSGVLGSIPTQGVGRAGFKAGFLL